MAADAHGVSATDRLRHRVAPVVGAVLFGLALVVLGRALREYRYADIVAAIDALPSWRIALAVGLTALSYLTLTSYDALALRYAARSLAYPRVALAAFVGYAFGHSLALLGASAVRYRLYASWGLSAVDVAKVLAFNALTFWLGWIALAGPTLLAGALAEAPPLHLSMAASRAAGVLCLLLMAGYGLWCVVPHAPLRLRDWEIVPPARGLALAQVLLATADWVLAAGVLYVLLPPAEGLGFGVFLGGFLLAQGAGLASSVPGGLGVFETGIVLFLTPFLAGPTIVGSLVAFRAVYYLLPLAVAGLLLAWRELVLGRVRFARLAHLGRLAERSVSALVPQGLAVLTFLAGAMLLASGGTPGAAGRLAWLGRLLPLPVIEVSHFLGSLVGVALLLLARGLQRRLDGAYVLAVALLAAGVAFSLLKGLDYEEAIILAGMLGALVVSRREFYRRASLLEQPFTSGWIVAITLVAQGAVWLVLLAHRHVEYSHDLWWQFALAGDAPRAMRATTGALVLLAGYGLARLLRPGRPPRARPTPRDLDELEAIVAAASRSSAYLALLGDKALLVNPERSAFVMYGVEGRSWVAMGDPVGAPADATELAWRFRELSDRWGGTAVFYEVGPAYLPLYVELGLSLLKLGEEGRVALATFGLEGSARKGLRYTHRRVAQAGCAFEIVPRTAVPALVAELRAVSDAWLTHKRAREKGFSLGFFEPAYLARSPVAVVRRAGRVVAFANLWCAGGHEELSIDMMRYGAGAPPGVMEYLFAELMLWGRGEGYAWFSLGMAPLSGLEDRALAPLWNRVGGFLFRYGEHFYNFQGLREYKDKFDPVWQPRYLAAPGGLALPRVLSNIATLIAGGLAGIVAR